MTNKKYKLNEITDKLNDLFKRKPAQITLYTGQGGFYTFNHYMIEEAYGKKCLVTDKRITNWVTMTRAYYRCGKGWLVYNTNVYTTVVISDKAFIKMFKGAEGHTIYVDGVDRSLYTEKDIKHIQFNRYADLIWKHRNYLIDIHTYMSDDVKLFSAKEKEHLLTLYKSNNK